LSGSKKPDLAKEFAVGTQSDKLQYFGVGLAINEQQVGFEAAFAMVLPFAAQSMIAVSLATAYLLPEERSW